MAEAVGNIDGDALVKKQDEEENVAIEGGDVESIVSLLVGDERVGAVVKEKIDDVVVTALSSPLEWCCDRVAAFPIHFGSMVDEELAHGILVVDGRPLLKPVG